MDTGGANLTVPNLFNFKDHVALITGGATGLGEMAAQGFIQNGGTVIIASRKKSELEKTAARLNKLGPGKCHIVVADLKDKAGCDHLVKEVGKLTDRLTVLLNNSGATWYISLPHEIVIDIDDNQGRAISRLSRIRLGQTNGLERQSYLLYDCRLGASSPEGSYSRQSLSCH